MADQLSPDSRSGWQRGIFWGSTLQSLGLSTTFQVVSSTPDLTPPMITGLAFSPSVIDTAAGSQNVTVVINATDDFTGVNFSPDHLSGISFLHGIQLRSPSGQQTRSAHGLSFQRTAGTAQNGTWTATIFFPQYSEGGTWTASVVGIKDAVRNHVSLSNAQLAAAGFPHQLVIFRPSQAADGVTGPAGGTVNDTVFGSDASVVFPPGALGVATTVAIDVLANQTLAPTPTGFSVGTQFVNINFNPVPTMPFPAPGLTIRLPTRAGNKPPGAFIHLYRLDPVSGLRYRPRGSRAAESSAGWMPTATARHLLASHGCRRSSASCRPANRGMSTRVAASTAPTSRWSAPRSAAGRANSASTRGQTSMRTEWSISTIWRLCRARSPLERLVAEAGRRCGAARERKWRLLRFRAPTVLVMHAR